MSLFSDIDSPLSNLHHSARNVDERVDLVEEGHDGLVSSDEVPLQLDLRNRKENVEERVVLEVENPDAIILCLLGDLFATTTIHRGSYILGHSIRGVVEGPVEHFHEEGILLQDSAVEMVGEAR